MSTDTTGLRNGAHYLLPDGTFCSAAWLDPGGWWELKAEDGQPLYGFFPFGVRRFVYDAAVDHYEALPCDLTVEDLRHAP